MSKARKYGYYLRQKYLDRDPEADKNRIRGISYRLLNALKTRNSEMFMHNIITSYMYIGEIIPKNITLALENEEMLGIIGYAFVTGLNGGDYKDENNDNGGEMMKIKGLTMSIIFEAESANYGETIGNVASLKKFSRGKGDQYTYISRQALRYNIVNQMGIDNTAVDVDKSVIQFAPDATIDKYPEIDLFGYMKTSKEQKHAQL